MKTLQVTGTPADTAAARLRIAQKSQTVRGNAILSSTMVRVELMSASARTERPPDATTEIPPTSHATLERNVLRAATASRRPHATIAAAEQAAAAYGCVDWYMYPDAGHEPRAAGQDA